MLTCDGDTLTGTSYITSDCSDRGTTNLFSTCQSSDNFLGDLALAFSDSLLGGAAVLGAGSVAFVCKTPAATVVTSFSLAGAIENFGAPEQAALKAVLAAGAGVSPSAVSLTLSPGSVIVTAEVLFKVAAAATAAVSALSGPGGLFQHAGNLESALKTKFQADGLDTTVTVEHIGLPKVEDESNDGGGSCGVGCIVGIVVLGVMALALGTLLFCGCAACCKKAGGGKPGAAGAADARPVPVSSGTPAVVDAVVVEAAPMAAAGAAAKARARALAV